MFDEKRDNLNGDPTYLSLGSNLGPRECNVLRALSLLELNGCGRVRQVSSLYETEPVDCEPMGRFVNAVLELQPLLRVEDLLKRLQALEKMMGRRSGHNEPREIDIDIVTFGDEVLGTNRLTIPHPRFRGRLFVLLPLQEIAPAFRCPLTGEGIEEMVAAVHPQINITRVSSRQVVRAPVCRPGSLDHV